MKVRIIVADEEIAYAGEVARGVSSGIRREVGTVVSQGETDCPLGRPNCRNCGDPDHAETCQAAGHCPQCGTAHGVTPEAILIKHGYRMEPV